MAKFEIRLEKLEKKPSVWAKNRKVRMEFHIDKDMRQKYGLKDSLFSLTGNVFLADMKQTRELAAKFNAKQDPNHPERYIKAGHLYAMGLIDEILHYVIALYREEVQPDAFETALDRLETNIGGKQTDGLLSAFSEQFPPRPVYKGEKKVDEYLKSKEDGESCKALSVEETMMLSLANLNPAFNPFRFLFDDRDLSKKTVYPSAIEELKEHFKTLPPFGPDGMNLWDLLRSPALASPDSLFGQLEYIRKHWASFLSKYMARLLMGLDVMTEEDKPSFMGPGPTEVLTFAGLDEYERFSPDQEWMPKTVLIAKSTLVWLFQLSQKYGREINRLDQIPDEEIEILARRGFTGLWLIGLWERSQASRIIKQWTGNPEAAASAYSLNDYDIAGELGGWGALANLRERCMRRGIRLGSDMVPNHTGIDSKWMIEHPDRFLQLPYPPFPTYNYNCGNLSGRDDITVQIEEHYFSRNDAAVVFKRIDNRTGETRYIYHGNDGTSMPWNDTAQIDFLNPEAREAVIRTIIGVCQQFSIVRFDAAMTLAKRHIQRLWYPVPGSGGAIASRAEHSISTEEFNRRIPNEFWREVVDRCAAEAPHTLLLAEAFWMMEGYFVRTLGMHRVYNSAFMNMLKNEENAKYRATIKNTMEFDPEILKRFVNFMNNPDEETAVAQFGKGDKYFGICTLLVTMPGLPMFGHGQIEGFEEKYGMEYRRSYRDEVPDGYMVERHERDIFPLMKRRYLFSGSENFRLYDLYCGGSVNECVFAYSNRVKTGLGDERALVFYNNSYYETSGWIKVSDPPIPCEGGTRRDTLSEALLIHGDSRYFTLLREQKSNLWYIRSSKAISEGGFFVGLKGYETQVFLDIYEVEDDEKGRWARLNNDSEGRGMADPLAAIKDIFLGELYYQFTDMFRPEIIDKLCNLKDKKYIAGDIKENAGEFFITAAYFMDGANGSYNEWAALDEKGVKRKFTMISNDDILVEFNLFLERMMIIKEALSKPAFPFLKSLKEHVDKGQKLCAIIMSYGLLSLLRMVIGKEAEGKHASDLAFTHWDLGRKLRNIFRSFGVSEEESWRITDIERVVLNKTALIDNPLLQKGGKFDAADFAALIIDENYLDADFRRILGINIFEDVTWFNKEGFDDALFYTSLFFLVEGSVKISMEERINRIVKIYDVLKKAEEKSEYRFDNLLEYLVSLSEKGKKKEKGKGKREESKEQRAKSKDEKPGAKVEAKKAEKPVKSKPAAKPEKAKAEKSKAAKPKTKAEKAKPKAKPAKPTKAKPKTKPSKPVKAKPEKAKPKAKPVKAKAGKAKPANAKPKAKPAKPEKAKTGKNKASAKAKGKKK